MNHNAFSVSDFTANQLNSKNVGVVEIMIMHLLNKCIQYKERWILSMDIVLASRNHLHRSSVPTSEDSHKVRLETEEFQRKTLPDLSHYDNSIYNIEHNIQQNSLILSRLIWRYGIDLKCKYLKYQFKDSKINWKTISYTRLKKDIMDVFKSNNEKLKFEYYKCPRDEMICTNANMGLMNHLQHFSKSLKLDIVDGNSNQTSSTRINDHSDDVSKSPYTPLVHGLFETSQTRLV
ncbi:hypothetical protein BC833DRAFT_598880 [Globomyces pollinis-pini]|nr:hypothetical protein BC833DRAFT_598880 [Globomyces pollinis-pini]